MSRSFRGSGARREGGPVGMIWMLALASALIGAIALRNAVGWYGHPIAGVLVTPEGNVSSIGLPDWDGLRQGLRFPERVVSVDGAPLPSPRGEAWDRAVAHAASAGRPTVRARVESAAGFRDVDLAIAPLSPAAWWLYGGGLILIGCAYAVAGLTALGVSPKGRLARAFAKFALLTSVFLFSLFDVHTTRALVPLFFVAHVWAPLALFALALRLPDDVGVLRRRPWVPLAIDGIGIGIGGVRAINEMTGTPTPVLAWTCSIVLGASTLVFVGVFELRRAYARGARRDVMNALFRSITPVYGAMGLAVLLATISGSVRTFVLLPALALAPIAMALASIRHDLWVSRRLVSRVVTRFAFGAFACCIAISVATAFGAWVGVPFQGALVGSTAGALLAIPLLAGLLRLVDGALFPARAHYKPTVEQLSGELTLLRSPEQVARAVERTVRRFLSCDYVQFVVAPCRPRVEDPSESGIELTLAATFGGEVLGHLQLGPRHGGARFTTDDYDLLSTIINQAALALAYARDYAELEARRRQQAAAWQAERTALVDTMAVEIAHEIRYPINFFRSIFRRGATGGRLDAEDMDIGSEEVERLERLVAGLRRPQVARAELRVVAVSELVCRTEVLLRDALGDRILEVDVDPTAAVRCEIDQATQIIVNLMSNALDACGPSGRVGLQWKNTDHGAELTVWDTGPGFTVEPMRLFAPWFTTKARGTGLGLAITQRLVRAHGWSIDASRGDDRTRFTVSIPATDLVTRGSSFVRGRAVRDDHDDWRPLLLPDGERAA